MQITFTHPIAGRSPRRGASRQNSSLFQYLTRFTDSGRHRNNVISTPPSGVVSVKRPSVDTDVEDDVESGGGDNGLTSEYNRLASPPVAYELPASEQRATYEDVRPRGLAVPQTAGRDDGFENSGRYDYVQSESVRYELSVDGVGQAPSTSQVPGHYETSQSFQVAPPSQHYAMSYATPSISQSRSETEVYRLMQQDMPCDVCTCMLGTMKWSMVYKCMCLLIYL